jgi:hypothetical protein
MKHTLLGIFLAMVCFGTASVSADGTLADDMKAEQVAQLKIDTAEADAKAAMARGDMRLLAVYGFTVEVPGVVESVAAARQKYGLRMLEGTGDALKSPRDKITNEIARKYAAKYNAIIVSQAARS